MYRASLDDHLAENFSRSGNQVKAVEYLHLAGTQAMARGALPHAIRDFEHAMTLGNSGRRQVFARLFQQTGRRDEARQILADTYGRYTEGFDTPDLKRAKALLDELEALGVNSATNWQPA
jgi:hypothetical protein